MTGTYSIRFIASWLAVGSTCWNVALADDLRGPVEALGGPGGPVASALVKQFDLDGDGHLNDAERRQAATEMLKRLDRNRNGRIDPDEQSAGLFELGARRPSEKPAEQGSLRKRLVERFDEDQDGDLNESERKLALKLLNRPAADRATNRLRVETLRRWDANGNNRLEADELDSFLDPAESDSPDVKKNASDQQPKRPSTGDR
jgi:Ca2+-binding EF-hand superfamily protein